MRVCVVGCGAVGSLFAAHLATLDEVEVWAYDVAPEHVAAINAKGLRLTNRADIVAPVHARTDAGEIPPCAFGIVATKSMFTERRSPPRRRSSPTAPCAASRTASGTRS